MLGSKRACEVRELQRLMRSEFPRDLINLYSPDFIALNLQLSQHRATLKSLFFSAQLPCVDAVSRSVLLQFNHLVVKMER